nr:amidohydrolase [Bacteroidales bacterium]
MTSLDLPNIRHTLHKLAEPSGAEENTRALILQILEKQQPSQVHLFPDSRNMLAVFDTGRPGPTLLFRGDFDAVRVDETLDLPYASATPGVAHKCGHDGHATILLGLAEQLYQQPLECGRVLLFFQAAE